VSIKIGRKTIKRKLKAGMAVKVKVPGRARSVKITARDGAGNQKRMTKRLRS
jgi:hypothetical protein